MCPYFTASFARSTSSMLGRSRSGPRAVRAPVASPLNAGTPDERQVHLRGGSRLADVVRMPNHGRPELDRVTEEQGPLRVGRRHDQVGASMLRAVGERDADHASVLRADLGHLCTRSGSSRRTTGAAETSASANARVPPRASTALPAAPPSLPAESIRNTAADPAAHGPIAVYSTPRVESGPRTASLLEHLLHQVGDGHRQCADRLPAGLAHPDRGTPCRASAR